MDHPNRLEFWNSRARNGKFSGTNDLNIKKIEIAELEKYFSDGLTVLEVGCGNGDSAEYFASKFKVCIDAIDFAEEMVTAATERILERVDLLGKIDFKVANIVDFDTK